MKMPGKAWLEFGIEPEGERNRLRVTAHYHTTSIGGRTYWNVLVPFHYFIFTGLIRQIEKRS